MHGGIHSERGPHIGAAQLPCAGCSAASVPCPQSQPFPQETAGFPSQNWSHRLLLRIEQSSRSAWLLEESCECAGLRVQREVKPPLFTWLLRKGIVSPRVPLMPCPWSQTCPLLLDYFQGFPARLASCCIHISSLYPNKPQTPEEDQLSSSPNSYPAFPPPPCASTQSHLRMLRY